MYNWRFITNVWLYFRKRYKTGYISNSPVAGDLERALDVCISNGVYNLLLYVYSNWRTVQGHCCHV